MEKGEIIERGTHDQLIEKEGKYFELWRMQKGLSAIKRKEQLTNNLNIPTGDNEISYFEDIKY